MSSHSPAEPADTLQHWSAEACRDLGIAPDYDRAEILDMARDVAHAVARPAAPLTAFLVGYAAAQHGGGPAEIERALGIVRALAAGQRPPDA